MDSSTYFATLKRDLLKFENLTRNQQSELMSLQQIIEQMNNRINELETAASDNIQLTNEINRLN